MSWRHRPVWALPVLDPALFFAPPTGQLPFPLGDPETSYVYFARNAIYHALRGLRTGARSAGPPRNEVLVPAYHHGVEVEALVAAGLEPRFFAVDDWWRADLADADDRGTSRTGILYLIHYAGFPQPVERARELCRERGWLLVEDCALSLLSASGGRPLGSTGDLSFFCLYKVLPVPNGGAVRFNSPELLRRRGWLEVPAPEPPPLASTASHLLGSWLGRLEREGGLPARTARELCRRGARAALARLGIERVAVGSDHFTPGHRQLSMSGVCSWLLERFDYAEVIARRRRNYLRLAELLGDLAPPLFTRLEPGVCPLFYPTRPSRWRRGAPRKAELVARLRARGVEAIDFWSGGHPEARGKFPATDRLREEVLELPIHQDLDERDLEQVARAVREALHA